MRYRLKMYPYVEAVKVNNTEYNPALWGTEHNPFDGPAFDDTPEWLLGLLNDNYLRPHNYGSTDYAQWTFFEMEANGLAEPDIKYPTKNLMPGDYILMEKDPEDGDPWYKKVDGKTFETLYEAVATGNLEGHAHGSVVGVFNKMLSSIQKNTNENNGSDGE